MQSPSEEQCQVVNAIQENHNVIVDACAGSGKSTTVLTCAKTLHTNKFIQITFNKQLQTEVQEKIIEEKLQNIQVYTYHGLAVKYYSSDCHNDSGIRKMLRENTPFRTEIPSFDVMVLDETQDMTKVYFDLIQKFILDMGEPIQLLILGDEKQALYGFKGADARFLTMADQCWRHFPALKTDSFEVHPLRMSYRITNSMRRFVNEAMLGENRMQSCREGPPVVYIRRSMYDARILYCMIQKLIQTEQASYDDFFILCRSLKLTNWSVRQLENILVQNNIPCFIPSNENKDDLDSRVIENKVVFSTFHASKGRQRPYVIVLGFDDSHFSHFARDKDPNICPNELYVACTRATKKLFVWESMDRKTSICPFVKKSHNEMMSCPYISFQGIPSGRKPQIEEPETYEIKKYCVQPTELIRFLPESSLDVISPVVDSMFTVLQPAENTIDIPSVHFTSNGYCEEVSDINGIVLPLMFFNHFYKKKENVLQDMIHNNMKDISKKHHAFLHDIVDKMPSECEDVSEYLYVANILNATQEMLYSRLKQIPKDEYTWVTQETLEICYARLECALQNETNPETWQSESYIIHKNNEIDHVHIDELLMHSLKDIDTIYRFTARADLITPTSLWELKCTSQLSMDHKLQLIVYAWLYFVKNKEEKKFYLFNIKTNELLSLDASIEQLTYVVAEIIRGKYYEPTVLSDEEFIAQFQN